MSKALATRLREVMEEVVHRNQTYCVPGRSMVDNVYLIRDVLDLSSSLGVDTGLISIDQEKAFDRVEPQYLWKVMERSIDCLHWLLEQSLVNGARLDLGSSAYPRLTVALHETGTLRQIVDVAGPGLDNVEAVSSLLGLRSVQVTRRTLDPGTDR
ncbi:hypothetical protein LDENG_00003480 [Lucifuga dentata]|nr:hypothetical protein LDENG_00003480 [Lucifuga dentata]